MANDPQAMSMYNSHIVFCVPRGANKVGRAPSLPPSLPPPSPAAAAAFTAATPMPDAPFPPDPHRRCASSRRCARC